MKTLYPYQRKALDAVLAVIRAHVLSALIVMATGLGKTVVAAALVNYWRRNKKKSVLFLVHLWEAVDQALIEFREVLGEKAVIQILQGGVRLDPNADVVLTTFQTMNGRYLDIPPKTFGLVMVDEGHRSKAHTYEPIIRYFKPAFLFAMTATPNRMDRQDIRELYGDEVFDYPLTKALADGMLAEVDYRVLIDNVDSVALKRALERVSKGDRTITRKFIDKRIFLAERLDRQVEIIRKEQKTRRQTIIFCNSRRHANAVQRHLPEAKTYVTGLSQGVLADRLAAFRSGRLQTLIVVNKLNEAVDIPDADLIIFLRSTESMTVWLQQLGRGLRKKLGKKNVLVLDFAANCDRVKAVGELAGEVKKYICEQRDSSTEIHKTGLVFNFESQARDVLELLERLNKDFYPTWEEASAAARRLKISSAPDYARRGEQDPRLPRRPDTFYENWDTKGRWYGFLGKRKANEYPTWEEASAAVNKLGITTYGEYRKKLGYKRDPRLPPNPEVKYREVWKTRGGWQGFFGKMLYQNWEDASRAAKQLGIVSHIAYRLLHATDPRLPPKPEDSYSSVWKKKKGWYGFLGKVKPKYYKTWDEASTAAKKLRCKNVKEYFARYTEDPKLITTPHRAFSKVWEENGGWPGFLGTTTARRKPKTKKTRRKFTQ